MERNKSYRVQVVEVESSDSDYDDAPPNPEPLVIGKRLSRFGFSVSQAGWSGSRFLAKLAAEQVNSIYVVHRHNTALADRLIRALENLDFAHRLVALTTAEVSVASDHIAETEVIEYVDALVVFRQAS